MELHLRLEGRRGLARQIHRQLRAAILEGRLRRGDRVPPTRELARRLAVSRNTVSLAYEWLVAEGLLSGRSGAGSYVEKGPVAPAPRRESAAIRHRAVWNRLAAPTPSTFRPRHDFGVGMPDATLFPFDIWRRLLARQIRGAASSAEYGDPAGRPELRATLARHLAVSRGVRASADDVIVTHGAQGAFDLIARVLIEPGVSVAVEEPGYPPVRRLFESYGARVAAVPVDASGLDIDALPDSARLVYVTPSHQFPLGMPLSHDRRAALVAWARRRGALIVEDDYDSEFRFGGRPLETLSALDPGGRVIYVGSFSKTLLPALRLGYVVCPPGLRQPLRAASSVACGFPQGPGQAALAAMLEGGLLARHVRRMRRAYAARHALILGTLERDFTRWLQPVPSVTGLHLTARLRSGGVAFEQRLADRARTRGVRFDRLSGYCASGVPQPGIVLGYGGVAEAQIPEALRRLRQCFAAVLRK